MDKLENLIGAVNILSDIAAGNGFRNPKPTGLLDVAATEAPPAIVNLYNECLKDKALVKYSAYLVTLHEIGAGKSEATRNYWEHSKSFRETLDRLEKVLTPLPNTPRKIKAIIGELTEILKAVDRYNKGIVAALVAMKAENDAFSGTAIA